MIYKAVKNSIVDEEGRQFLIVLPVDCTKKRARMLTARLAEFMNAEERRLESTNMD
jgi:hypothetical protein